MDRLIIAHNYHPNEEVASFMAQATFQVLLRLEVDAILIDLENERSKTRYSQGSWAESMSKFPRSRKEILNNIIEKYGDIKVFSFHDSNVLELARCNYPTEPFFVQTFWHIDVECPAFYSMQSDRHILQYANGKEREPKEMGYFTTKSNLAESITERLCTDIAINKLAEQIKNYKWRK